MASRLTTMSNQEIAGSTPAVVIQFAKDILFECHYLLAMTTRSFHAMNHHVLPDDIGSPEVRQVSESSVR